MYVLFYTGRRTNLLIKFEQELDLQRNPIQARHFIKYLKI